MLQQTQVATVIPYYHKWLHRFSDFASLARASENEVLRAWQGLRYYARARNLHATARTIMDQHGGRFPRRIALLPQFPRIGKNTAPAGASSALEPSLAIVESKTARALGWLFNFRGSIDADSGGRTVWRHAKGLIPKSDAGIFNSALLDLGALICVA